MRKALLIALAGLLLAAWTADYGFSRGGRGGGGGGRGGGGGGNRGGGGGGRTPSVNRSASRPASRSATRPSTSRPATANRPASRPATTRPSKPAISRPGSGAIADNRPSTRPATRPSTRPDRPNVPDRPATRPGQGGGGIERPGIANRPNVPDRPGGRPGRDEVGDFLGITAGAAAGAAVGAAAGSRLPDDVRDRVDNANMADRRDQAADRLDNRADRASDRLDHQGERVEDRLGSREDRAQTRRDRADDIRDDIGDRHNDCFTHDWWDDHCHWHDHWHDFNGDFHYWWAVPTWGAFTGRYAADWGQPYYYDYGSTVVYEGDTVYYQDQPVATAAEYYTQAADIAAAGAAYEQPEDAKVEDTWLPLGVFAVTPEHTDAEATLMLQLAIDREGHIDGTLYNEATDQASRVTGSVDKKTQRAAWTIEGHDDVVVETGIYNLTEQETPVLVHFGSDRTETWMLARLAAPEEGAAPVN